MSAHVCPGAHACARVGRTEEDTGRSVLLGFSKSLESGSVTDRLGQEVPAILSPLPAVPGGPGVRMARPGFVP